MEYARILEAISEKAESGGSDDESVLQFVCDLLRREDSRYNWVGFYIVKGEELVLDAFSGEETEHVRIKIGDGLCSLAVLKNETVNEADVKSNTTYLACFPSTASEIVVPVRIGDKPIGEIDIDSDTKSAFGMKDEQFLSEIANLVSKQVESLYLKMEKTT